MEVKKQRGDKINDADWKTEYVQDDSGKTCTVSNALKEAYYEVRYQPVIDTE